MAETIAVGDRVTVDQGKRVYVVLSLGQRVRKTRRGGTPTVIPTAWCESSELPEWANKMTFDVAALTVVESEGSEEEPDA